MVLDLFLWLWLDTFHLTGVQVWHQENPAGLILGSRVLNSLQRAFRVSFCLVVQSLGFWYTRDLETLNLKDWNRFSTIWIFLFLLHESVGTLKLWQHSLSCANILFTRTSSTSVNASHQGCLLKIESPIPLQTVWEWSSEFCFLKQTFEMILRLLVRRPQWENYL